MASFSFFLLLPHVQDQALKPRIRPCVAETIKGFINLGLKEAFYLLLLLLQLFIITLERASIKFYNKTQKIEIK